MVVHCLLSWFAADAQADLLCCNVSFRIFLQWIHKQSACAAASSATHHDDRQHNIGNLFQNDLDRTGCDQSMTKLRD